jgi:hypothetical protein
VNGSGRLKPFTISLITIDYFHSCHHDKTRFGMRDASTPCVVCTASAAAAPTGTSGCGCQTLNFHAPSFSIADPAGPGGFRLYRAGHGRLSGGSGAGRGSDASAASA